jgi:hypothetical protein
VSPLTKEAKTRFPVLEEIHRYSQERTEVTELLAIRDYRWDPVPGSPAKCFLEQFLDGHSLYNAHAGVQRMVLLRGRLVC